MLPAPRAGIVGWEGSAPGSLAKDIPFTAMGRHKNNISQSARANSDFGLYQGTPGQVLLGKSATCEPDKSISGVAGIRSTDFSADREVSTRTGLYGNVQAG